MWRDASVPRGVGPRWLAMGPVLVALLIGFSPVDAGAAAPTDPIVQIRLGADGVRPCMTTDKAVAVCWTFGSSDQQEPLAGLGYRWRTFTDRRVGACGINRDGSQVICRFRNKSAGPPDAFPTPKFCQPVDLGDTVIDPKCGWADVALSAPKEGLSNSLATGGASDTFGYCFKLAYERGSKLRCSGFQDSVGAWIEDRQTGVWGPLGLGAQHYCLIWDVEVFQPPVCTGDNTLGQASLTLPTSCPGGGMGGLCWPNHRWRALSVGLNASCALDPQKNSDGIYQSGKDMYCWGRFGDADGTYGPDSGDVDPTGTRLAPTGFPAGKDWSQVSVGYRQACGITADSSLYCWGVKPGASKVPTSAGPGSPAYTGWTSVEVGAGFACGVPKASRPICWKDDAADPDAEPTTSQGPAIPLEPVTVTPVSGQTLTSSYSTKVNLSGIDPAGKLVCQLDSEDPHFCVSTSPRELQVSTEGNHSFKIWNGKSEDRPSDTYAGPITTFSWTVDRTPPSAPTKAEAMLTYTRDATPDYSVVLPDGAARLTCAVDGGVAKACPATGTLAKLTDGAHKVAFVAYDDAGNASDPLEVSITVDLFSPAAPTLVDGPSGKVARTTVTFTIAAEPGATLDCSFDGAAATPCTSPVTLEDTGTGPHTLAVSATNAIGMRSKVATFPWTVDANLPDQPTITSAPSGFINNRSPVSITFSGDAGAKFKCSKDGAAYKACVSPYAFGTPTEGKHSLLIKQTVGLLTSEAAKASWTTDSIRPVLPKVVGDPAFISTSVGFLGSANQVLTAQVKDEATFTCVVDYPGNDPFVESDCSAESSTPGISVGRISLSNLKEGIYRVRIYAVDLAGNEGPFLQATWTVDLTAPEPPTFSSSPATVTGLTSASFSFSGEVGATFLCALDAGPFTACSSPKTLTGLDPTDHEFKVKAVDLAGNVSDAKTVSWTIEAGAPPAPVFKTKPDSLTSATSVSFDITQPDYSTMTCSLDGAVAKACTSAPTFTGLKDGAHSLKVTVSRGGATSSETATWTVDSKPPAKPTFTSASGSLSVSGEAGATIECSVDGGDWSACTSPVTIPNLPEGAHTIDVRLTDSAGNVSPPGRFSWTVDPVAPAAPTITSSPQPITGLTTVSFGFSGEAGSRFTCSVDSGAFVACTSPRTVTGLKAGDHTFAVKTVDGGGRASDATVLSWKIDTTAPPLPVFAVQPPSVTGSTTAIFNISAPLYSTVSCSLDKAALKACPTELTITGLKGGPHVLTVTATRGGTATSSATYNWTVDTTPPAKPSVGLTKTGLVTFSGEVGATFQCSIDGGSWRQCLPPVMRPSLPDGSHTLTVRQTDGVGNVSAATSFGWTVDTVAPVAPNFTSRPKLTTGLTSASFSFTSEAGATFTCSLDSGGFLPCKSPRVLSGLRAGDHSFAVKAVDAAGNVSGATSFSWKIDLGPPPAAVIDAKPNAVSGSTSATFNITPPSDSDMTCSIDTRPFAACASPVSYSGLAAGSHTFRVKVTRGAAVTTSTYTWKIDLSIPAKPTWASAPSGYFGFSGASGSTFECSIDSGAFEVCVSPLKIPTLPDGDHSIAIRQRGANGIASAALSGTWKVDVAGRVPTVTGTSVNAFQTLELGDQSWHLSAQLVVAAGGTNSNSVLTLAQVSYAVAKPAATPVPTVASAVDGVYDWQGTDVQVPSGEIVVGDTVPTWIRVGTAGGQWTDWLPVTTS